MKRLFHCLLALAATLTASRAQVTPPEPPREFRGTWIASVHNIDWPTKKGLTADEQRQELAGLIKRAADMRLNAVILQARPQCDALYQSRLEPWSPFLTGSMGATPGYDPLAFAIEEAHARGLELHAWFNPFRALTSATATASEGHVTRRRPDWIRSYGTGLWLDPGDPAARAHSLNVILDVLRRYDVDGIHIDDYFYPYPVKANGTTVPFPDDATWQRYGGGLPRDDWRRANINQFVQQLYRSIKEEKRGVKFGISPFGIWRPGVPATIEADLDSYAHLYADSRRWLRNGWCDYMAPQLYWPIQPAKQSYSVLLDWWRGENSASRHLWPGLAVDRIGRDRGADEIVNQISFSRSAGRNPGQILWSAKNALRNQGGVTDALQRGVYLESALVPASPWLGVAPSLPRIERSGRKISLTTDDGKPPRWWVVQTRRGEGWDLRVLPGGTKSVPSLNDGITAVRTLDRAGNLSPAVVIPLR